MKNPKTERVTTYLCQEKSAELREFAERAGLCESPFVRGVLRAYLGSGHVRAAVYAYQTLGLDDDEDG